MRRLALASLATTLLFLGACQTDGGGTPGSFRSNANKAVTNDPYAAASK